MIRFRKLLAVMLLSGIVIAGLLAGCDKFDPGTRDPNVLPETTLSFSPDEGDTANYRVRLNWFGWDEDGEIAYYQTVWDWPDSIVNSETGEVDWEEAEWRNVVNTDSVFLVSASADTVTEDRGFEGHRFAVRSVDNELAKDDSPETIEFTAFTVVPNTEILRGPSGVTGPMVTFEWIGRDRDGVITGYQYNLYRWDDSTSDWILVFESDLEPFDEVVRIFGPLAGRHKFEVRAIDDAGAWDQTPATSIFTCNPELAGPKLYVGSNVFELFTFRGPVWPPRFNIPIPIFAGERLLFGWAATAEDYGGEVLGYRHAYDDTTVWPAWSIFDRFFQVTPDLGRHSLYVSAIDNANVVTRGRVFFDVVEASLNEYILIVDDYNWWEHNPQWGTDAERNAFYDGLMVGYTRQRVEWEPSQHIEEGQPQPPDVDALRGASTVLWYTDGEQTVLGTTFDPFEVTYNALAGYLRVGGNLILCGYKNMWTITGEPYPITIAPTDTIPSKAFVRDFLHLGYGESSGTAANKSAPWNYGYCFYGAVPDDPGQFAPVYIDSVGPGGFPEPGKWPVYTWTQPQYRRGGLPQIEKVEAYQGTALEFYKIDAYLNMNFEGQTCGVLYLSGDNHTNTCYLTFPLYYMQTEQVLPMMDKIMALFGEEKVQ